MVQSRLKNMESKQLAQLCRDYADNKKAEKLAVLDVRDLSSVADFFVIASGTSEPHVRAIVEEITDKLRDEHDVRPRAVDGSRQGAWIVMDFFDVIVHVMRQDARDRYDLEGLWSDAARVKVPKAKAVRASNAKPRVKKPRKIAEAN
jgi:ribosome-associated protein